MKNDNEKLLEEFNKLNSDSSVRDLQEYIKNMMKTREFDNQTAEDVMLILTEELGEVAKEVRKTTNLRMDINKKRELNLDKEIADVFIMLLSLCSVTNIDLFEAFKSKEKINFKREWK